MRRAFLKTYEAAQNVPALAFLGWPMLPFLPRPQSQILTYATWRWGSLGLYRAGFLELQAV